MLRERALTNAQDAQRFQAAQTEANELRRAIGAAEQLPVQAAPAEVLYLGRDPYAQKLFINRGSVQNVQPGSPVIDDVGVIGQVTRVHPLVSEVNLLTNPDQAVPVQVVRNGLRAVAFGARGQPGMLELRYVGANAEIQNGDRLVTSGIDGTYPAGLQVATVVKVETDAEQSFARVLCRPTAGVDRGRNVLILASEANIPPRPDETEKKDRRTEKARRGKGKDKNADRGDKAADEQ